MPTSEINYQLAGTIRHLGLPVAGVELRLFESRQGLCGSCLHVQKTGPRGEYAFALPSGNYSIQMLPPANTRFVAQLIPDIAISSNTKQDFTLNTGMTVTGVVQNVAEVSCNDLVIILTDTQNGRQTAVTAVDASGKFELIVPKGQYELLLTGKTTANANTDEYLQYSREVLDISRDLRCEMTLCKTLSFNGKITNDAQIPLPGVTLELSPIDIHHPGIKLETISDANGCFNFSVTAGAYELLLRPAVETGLTAVARRLNVVSEEPVSLVLSDGHTIQGLVAYNNEPVAVCRIQVKSEDGLVETVVVSDEQGQFALKLPDGQYAISIDSINDPLKKGSQKQTAPFTRFITVSGPTDIIAELQDGYTLRFDVVNDVDAPLGDCKLTYGPYNQEPEVLNKPRYQRHPDLLCGTAVTDENGIAQLTIPSGVYFFEIQPPPSSEYAAKHIRQLSISTQTRRKVKMIKQIEQPEPAALQLTINGVGLNTH